MSTQQDPTGLNVALWEFPHEMTLKVFGEAEVPEGAAPLADIVCAIIRRQLGDFTPRNLQTRASSGGKYLSVSVDITVLDREQVEGIYRDLRAEPRVRTAI